MTTNRRQEILSKQRENNAIIARLNEDNKALRQELKDLEKRARFESLLPQLLKVQGEWSIERPAVKVNAGSLSHGYCVLKTIKPPGQQDLGIKAFAEENLASNKWTATITICNGWRTVSRTQKTYKNGPELNAGLPELYYIAVLKAINKLVNEESDEG